MGFLKVLSSQKIVCMEAINYLLSSKKCNFLCVCVVVVSLLFCAVFCLVGVLFFKAYLVSFNTNLFLGV